MPDTIRHRVQMILQQRIAATGDVSFSGLRDHVLRHYQDNWPAKTRDDWDRWQRDAVMREVQTIIEDMQ